MDYYLPITIALDHTTWRFKETTRAEPAHNFFRYASWAFYLVAVLTVEQLFRRIHREIGSRGPGVEGLFFLFIVLLLGVFLVLITLLSFCVFIRRLFLLSGR